MMQPIKVTFIEPAEGWAESYTAFVVDKHTVVKYDEGENVFTFRRFESLAIDPGQTSLTVRIGIDNYRVLDLPAVASMDASMLDELTVAKFVKIYFEKGRG